MGALLGVNGPVSDFSREDWGAVVSREVPFPEGLPDDLVRALVDLMIHVRSMPAMLAEGLSTENPLPTYMPLSLTSGVLKRIAEIVARELGEAPFDGV